MAWSLKFDTYVKVTDSKRSSEITFLSSEYTDQPGYNTSHKSIRCVINDYLFTLLIVQYFGLRPFSRRNMYFMSHYIFSAHHFLLVYQSDITSPYGRHAMTSHLFSRHNVIMPLQGSTPRPLHDICVEHTVKTQIKLLRGAGRHVFSRCPEEQTHMCSHIKNKCLVFLQSAKPVYYHLHLNLMKK